MRIPKTLISRLALTAAGAAFLGACSGTGEPSRSLLPGARSADVASGPPTVANMAPQNGPTAGGTTVTLSGTGFDASTQVTVAGQSVPVQIQVPLTRATFTMVAGQGTVAVQLSTAQGMAPVQSFHYDPPTLTAINPLAGPSAGGTRVTLTGTNFGLTPAVTFGTSVAPVVSASHTEIVVNAPAGVPGQALPVHVTTGNQNTPASPVINYTYLPPTITGITPDHGPTVGGNAVTLVGQSFGAATPAVSVNGTTATVVRADESSVVFTAPAGEGKNAAVVVRAGSIGSNPVSYSYDPPVVADVQPTSGPTAGGTQITIAGVNFGNTAAVSVGGVNAVIVSRGQANIVATTPAGTAGPAPVVVTVAGQSSNSAATFTYVAPTPTVAGVFPTSGPAGGGTMVTLTGSGFGASPKVTVGGTTVTPQTATNVRVIFPMIAGEGTTPIAVVTEGGVSNSVSFTYNPPSIGSIVPANGPSAGGYLVTLSGSSFGLHPTVTVDGANASLFNSSDSQIIYTAPAGEPGHDAQVRVSAGGQTSNTSTFHYNAPTLANIGPSHGPTSGGTVITLTGANFGTSPGVLFNGAVVPVLNASQTQITFASTPGQGSASVVVKAGAATSNALSFTYDAPSLAALSPTSGPVAGGTRVTINGSNFGLTPTVMFGPSMVPLISATHNQIVVNSPAGAPASVPVIVTVAGLASNALSFQYLCPDGTVLSNGACATPVAALGNVVASLPPAAQTQLAPVVADITTKLTDNNPSNDNGACGQLNAVSKQTAALLKSGQISPADAGAVQSAIGLVSSKAGCK